MQIITDPLQLQRELAAKGGEIGFVPTMGALHQGHLSLIRQSVGGNDLSVVSVFVNPTQFLPGEDLAQYPRRAEADRHICERAGVDILFLPRAEDFYDQDEVAPRAPKYLGYILEGHQRPGHFDGVLQVVLKLFNLVRPARAYFGRKDAQQLVLIQKMVQDLFLPIEIVASDTVRESDGLAMSSRNAYLGAQDREKALLISKSLKIAGRMVMSEERRVEVIEAAMAACMEPLDVEYIAFVNRRFESCRIIEPRNSIILVAAKVGSTRLIDNLWL